MFTKMLKFHFSASCGSLNFCDNRANVFYMMAYSVEACVW